jgi:hypothetical protein
VQTIAARNRPPDMSKRSPLQLVVPELLVKKLASGFFAISGVMQLVKLLTWPTLALRISSGMPGMSIAVTCEVVSHAPGVNAWAAAA